MIKIGNFIKGLKKLFSKKQKKRPKAISKLISEELELITYEELNSIPYNTVEQIVENKRNAITCTRIKSPNKRKIYFRVTMKKGEKWYNHYHDCYESIMVYTGSIYNELDKNVVSKLEVKTIKPYEKHVIKALEDSVIYVEFYKKLNK